MKDFAKHPTLRQSWYLDDGNMRSRAVDIRELFDKLTEDLSKRGLRINRAKCEVYTKNHSLVLPHQLVNIPLV